MDIASINQRAVEHRYALGVTVRPDTDVDPRVRRTQRDVVRAAAEILLESGWSAVTHSAVAERAGYAKATLYNHWPDRTDLGRAAFLEACPAPDYVPTGDLRTDLIGDLSAFSAVLAHGQLGRVLAALAERAPQDPALAELLHGFVTDGSAQLVRILTDHGHDPEAAETMRDLLSGAVVFRVVLRQLDPSPGFIESAVDHALAGL